MTSSCNAADSLNSFNASSRANFRSSTNFLAPSRGSARLAFILAISTFSKYKDSNVKNKSANERKGLPESYDRQLAERDGSDCSPPNTVISSHDWRRSPSLAVECSSLSRVDIGISSKFHGRFFYSEVEASEEECF
nr:hypothetical protein Iba_chr14bCG11290 [Ipomoea batatas]